MLSYREKTNWEGIPKKWNYQADRTKRTLNMNISEDLLVAELKKLGKRERFRVADVVKV